MIGAKAVSAMSTRLSSGSELQRLMSPAGCSISNVGMRVVRVGWWSAVYAVYAVSSVADNEIEVAADWATGGGLMR